MKTTFAWSEKARLKKMGGLGKVFNVTAPQKDQGCYASLEDQSEILEFNRTTPCVSRTLLMVTEQVTVHVQGRKLLQPLPRLLEGTVLL